MSIFAARYVPEGRRLLYSNAGHNPPLLLRHGTDWVDRLDTEGLIAGVVEEATHDVGLRDLNRGDRILFYTDGLVEARGPDGFPFGEERLEAALREVRALSAEGILDAVFQAVERHVAGERYADDVTVVAPRRGMTGPPASPPFPANHANPPGIFELSRNEPGAGQNVLHAPFRPERAQDHRPPPRRERGRSPRGRTRRPAAERAV